MRIEIIITAIVFHLLDNRGEVKFSITDEDSEYRVNKVKYIVTATFDDESEYDLYTRFRRLIENSRSALTEENDHVTIESENVSAVGKEQE